MLHFVRFKIVVVTLIAILVSVLCSFAQLPREASILYGWLTFGSLYLVLSLMTIFSVKSSNIVNHAEQEDLGVWLQFLLLIGTCATALVTVVLWRNERFSSMSDLFFILSITFAWLILHTSFIFRYAHMYYGDKNERYQRHIRGLEFPHDTHPDYLDFAYYSFTIGMTFQVSDVVIKSKGIRRLTLLHSMISFLFNTILIAITINELVNL